MATIRTPALLQHNEPAAKKKRVLLPLSSDEGAKEPITEAEMDMAAKEEICNALKLDATAINLKSKEWQKQVEPQITHDRLLKLLKKQGLAGGSSTAKSLAALYKHAMQEQCKAQEEELEEERKRPNS